MADPNMGMWAQLALTNPDAAAGMLAAAGVTPTGSSFAGDPYLAGGGASAAPNPAVNAAGGGADQGALFRGLSGAQAAAQPKIPGAQYIPPAPLPWAASATINPSAVIAQIAPLLLAQQSQQGVPTLAQLISGA